MTNTLLEIAGSRTDVGSEADSIHFWISDQELLWLRHAALHDQPPLRVREGVKFRPGDPGHYEAIVIDIATAEKRPLEIFNARCAPLMTAHPMQVHYEGKSEYDVHYLPPRCTLSPDGKRLLWRCENVNGRPGWSVALLDGSRQWVWQEREPNREDLLGHPLWMSDSHRWIELISDYWREKYRLILAHVRSIDTPETRESFRIAHGADGMALGLNAEQQVLLCYREYRGRSHPPIGSLRMRTVGLQPGFAMTQEYTIALPEAEPISDLVLSPDGRRLAWMLGEPHSDPDIYTLWISNVRGRDFRKLGEVSGFQYDSPQPITGQRYDWPRSLAWLPGGRQVSFLFKDAVYTVAAD